MLPLLPLSDTWAEQFARRYSYFVLGLLFIPVLVVILLDRRAWPWDEAFYAQHSVSLFRTLTTSPTKWLTAMVHVLGDRAPLLVWIGQFFVPIGRLLPQLQTALLLVTLCIQAISVALLYRALAALWGQSLPALLASCLVVSGSLFTGLTYRYFVDPLQVTSVVWLLILAVSFKNLNRVVLGAHLVAAISFGLLVKTSTPMYQLPLIVYLAISLSKDLVVSKIPGAPSKPIHTILHLILAALLFVGAVSWYRTNFIATYQHVIQAASGELSIYYGSNGDLLTKLSFWSTALINAFWGRAVATLLLFMLGIATIQRWKSKRAWQKNDTLALVSLLWIGVLLVLFSRTTNEDTRYLIGLAPYTGIITAWIFSNVRSQRWIAAFTILLFIQFGRVTAQAFGLALPSSDSSGYLLSYVSDATALQDSLFAAQVTREATRENPVLVGCEMPEFNGAGLAFYREAQSWILGLVPGSFIGFDWTQPNPDDAWKVVLSVHPKYFVYRKHDASLDASVFNRLAKSMLIKVEASNQFRLVPRKSNQRVLVYEFLPPH